MSANDPISESMEEFLNNLPPDDENAILINKFRKMIINSTQIKSGLTVFI